MKEIHPIIQRLRLKDHMEVVGYKEAFDEYHVKHKLDVMEKLLAGYVECKAG